MRAEAAADLYRRGFSIVPAHMATAESGCSCRDDYCDRPGKHPRVRWSVFQDRKPSEAEVTQWWRRWPEANIAVVTGAVSGIVVLDIDPRHGGDDTLAEWENANGKLPDTVICLTGGGGAHYFFKHPGEHVPPGADVIGSGVDVRGDGGYVIAAGSMHESGKLYEWDSSAHPDDIELADLPATLLKAMQKKDRPIGERLESVNLDLIIEGVAKVPKGSRNDTMTKVCGQFAGQGFNEAAMMAAMTTVNEQSCDPPLKDKEIKRIVTSIARREARKSEVRNAVETRLKSDGTKPFSTDELSASDVLDMAAALWRDVGVNAVTDWFVMRGDETSYVLVTPEDEIGLGPDLLNYAGIRRRLLNEARVLAPKPKQIGDWDKRALLLRTLAREEEVEPVRASERISEWLDSYAESNRAEEIEVIKRAEFLASGPILVDGALHFRPGLLAQYVELVYGERITVNAMRRMLTRGGYTSAVVRAGSGTARAWRKVR